MNQEQSNKWDAAEEGVELLQTGQVDEAAASLLAALSVDPRNEYAHFFLGNAYYEKEAYPEALKCFVEALDIAPEYFGAMIGAGQALRMMGEYDKAIRMAQSVLKSRKDDPDALYLLGVVHFQRGENQAAKGYLERFLETNPELEIALEVEGMLQVVRGEVLPFPGAEDTVEN